MITSIRFFGKINNITKKIIVFFIIFSLHSFFIIFIGLLDLARCAYEEQVNDVEGILYYSICL